MKEQFLTALTSLLGILGQCLESIRSDVNINYKAPNVSVLIMSSISYKIEQLFECVRVFHRLFKPILPFKRSENSKNNSVAKDRSSKVDHG